MGRQTIVFGTGGGTVFAPLALALLVVAGVIILVLPRRYAVMAFLAAALLIPMSQQIVAGVTFSAYRLLILVGLVRIYTRGESRAVQWMTPLDRSVAYFSYIKVVTFTLLWLSVSALINRLGYLVDDLVGYYVLRCLIRDGDDLQSAFRALGWLSVTLALMMSYEYATNQNPASVLGAPVAATFDKLRDGKVRAQGTFAHAILAGTFGATLFPIFFGFLVYPGKMSSRLLGALGTLATATIVIVSTSSGPYITFGAAIIGLLAWPFRKQTRLIKWGLIGLIVGLHIVMQDPVWALLYKARFIGGGSGYHRYQLIDQSIKHFSEWWLFGTKNNWQWGYDMWDLANNYVACAVTGGLITLFLFCLMLHRTYLVLSSYRAAAAAKGEKGVEWQAWTLTVSVMAHSVAYFGISYFDQTKVLWVVFLALVVAASLQHEQDTATAPVRTSDAYDWRRGARIQVRANLYPRPSSAALRQSLAAPAGSRNHK